MSCTGINLFGTCVATVVFVAAVLGVGVVLGLLGWMVWAIRSKSAKQPDADTEAPPPVVEEPAAPPEEEEQPTQAVDPAPAASNPFEIQIPGEWHGLMGAVVFKRV